MSDDERDVLEAKLALEAEIEMAIVRAGVGYLDARERAEGQPAPMERVAVVAALERALLRHFARVILVMRGERPPKDPTLAEACQSLIQLDNCRRRARFQADLIVRSIDRELAAALATAPAPYLSPDGTEHYAKGDAAAYELKAALERKDDTVPEEPRARVSYIAKLKEAVLGVYSKLKSKLAPTAANIATQETAEEARRVQIELVKPELANGHIFKEWRNCHDERVRGNPAGIYPNSKFDHWSCEGQRVPVAEAFTISGEKMRFPGDAALGSTLANRINCRCVSRYVFVKDDGTEHILHQSPSAPTRAYRRPGEQEPPPDRRTPSTFVTLNGTTRARVVLANHEFATLRQPTPTTVEVLRNGKVVARAKIENGAATHLQVDEGSRGLGIEDLITRSVEHSARMDRRPYSERVPH